MIDCKEMDFEISKALKHMENGESLTFKTYKKDRSLTLMKTEQGFRIVENGYRKATYETTDVKTTKKQMKNLIEDEFPRSNKVWMQKSKGTKTNE